MTSSLTSIIILSVISNFCLKSGLSLFQANITAKISPKKDNLLIQVDTHKYNYTLYKLEFLKCVTESDDCLEISDNMIEQKQIHGKYPITETVIHGPFLNGTYCIRVTPVHKVDGGSCEKGCRTEWKRVTINTTDMPDCKNWVLSNFKMEPSKTQFRNFSLKVFLDVNPIYSSCFNQLNVSLWMGNKEACNNSDGSEHDSKVCQVTPGYYTVAIFDDLLAGNYCVRLYAQSRYCFGWCTPLFSVVLEIPGPDFTVAAPTQHPGHEVHIWPYILGSCIVLIIISIAILYKHFRLFFKQKIPVRSSDLLEADEDDDDELEIVLLYSRDFEEHEMLISSFQEFLYKCCGFHKIHSCLNEEHLISIDRFSWAKSITDFHPNRRFIIVESEGWMLQESHNKDFTVLEPFDGDMRDAAFIYVIKLLQNSALMNWDYKYVFVVKFEYTLDSKRITSFVPKCRFHLPRQLFDLYCALISYPLSSLQEKEEFEEEMNGKWRPFLEDKLIPCIETCKERLKEKPTLIKDSFVVRNLLDCD